MVYLVDLWKRDIRLTDERLNHLETDHPEMNDQAERIAETLLAPDEVRQSKSDQQVELFYKLYAKTPVTTKFLCVVVKASSSDHFIITAYYTDSIKKGVILWEKK